MNNKSWIIILIVSLLVLVIIYVKLADFNPKTDDDKLIKKIEKLENKLDSINCLKDSIRTVVDSTHVKIVENEKRYQEKINTIITKPDSFSDSFTRQYIREYTASHGYHLR